MSLLTRQPPAPSSPAFGWDALPEQRFVLLNVDWADYLAIGRALCDRANLRCTYDRGSLELMTTSPQHEKYKKWLGRLVEILAEEFNLPIESAGSTTFQREDLERGFEPDDCFWIQHERQMRGRLDWDPARDPPPDLMLEIEISRSAQKRVEIFAAFKVPEVWRFDSEALTVHVLQADGTYQISATSPTFPGIAIADLVRFAMPSDSEDSLSRIRAFRVWVQEQLAARNG
jgi:Uma2 family endonuclease